MQCSPLPLTRTIAFLVGTLICALALTSSASAQPMRISAPKAGATLSRTATFTPRLTKALKKKTHRVEVWVGSKRVALDSKAPFRAKLDTRRLADGQYTFQVRALVRGGKRAFTARAKFVSRAVKAVISNAKRGGKQPSTGVPISKEVAPAAPPVDPRIGDITGGGSGYRMIFNDEFDGSSLNSAKWNNQRDDWLKQGVPYNGLEGAWYGQQNSTVEGGVLKQTIRKLPSQMTTTWGNFDYTTGMVNTNKRFGFTYGYVESRMRVPACSGCWPAFWMLPMKEGWPPEIDIFEFFDSATLKFPYFSSHWKGTTTEQEYTTLPTVNTTENFTDDWHTYGMLWTPTSVQGFVDGRPGPIYTGKAVPHEDMYLIIQQAIGQGFNTPDGVSLQTDYVRVYQQG